VVDAIREATFAPHTHALGEDPKLLVALELYGAFYSEKSSNARFLTLVMALEALTEGRQKPDIALAMLAKWKADLAEERKKIVCGTEESLSLDSLERELLFRKTDSIRSQIHRVVFDGLTQAGEVVPGNWASGALGIYDLGSKLVHDGRIDSSQMSSALSDVKLIVEDVLRARFRKVIGL